jgi:hypothetical protein
MARVVRAGGRELFGHLDHPKCRGSLSPGPHRIEFEAWFRGREWFHEDPGPNAPYQPKTEKMVVDIEALVSGGREIILIVQGHEEDFVRSLPGFTAA